MVGAQVVHETLDGETVVINLASGSYYSLEGTATGLWEALVAGEPAQVTADRLAADHGADPAAVLAAVEAFHGELFAEQLSPPRRLGRPARSRPAGSAPSRCRDCRPTPT